MGSVGRVHEILIYYIVSCAQNTRLSCQVEMIFVYMFTPHITARIRIPMATLCICEYNSHVFFSVKNNFETNTYRRWMSEREECKATFAVVCVFDSK